MQKSMPLIAAVPGYVVVWLATAPNWPGATADDSSWPVVEKTSASTKLRKLLAPMETRRETG
jgi:hypothetical protein